MRNLNNFFENKLTSLKKIFKKYDLLHTTEFKRWENDFSEFYSVGNVNIDLYFKYSLLYFLSVKLVDFYIFKNDLSSQKFIQISRSFKNKTEIDYEEYHINKIDYFTPIIQLFSESHIKQFISFINEFLKYIKKQQIKPYYYLDFAIQRLVASEIRHNAGEFYTPPFLTNKMVEFSYKFGEKVLDPCCGSGNFLIAIIKQILETKKSKEDKIKAVKNLFGFDINPMSIFMAEINLLILLREKGFKIPLNLFNLNSLNPKNIIEKNNFDLVIGNPPWYTFRDIDSIEQQNFIKNLADSLNIKPRPKNILNTEIATIFFYQCLNLFLKEGGKIFFVLSEGIITGSHASRFRNFTKLKEVCIWSFSPQIQGIFNVKFICVFAKKSGKIKVQQEKIPNFLFNFENDTQSIGYFDDLNLKLYKKDSLIPYDIIEKRNRIYTKKLISEKNYKQLGNLNESPYKTLFHKGADLNPRNLIFVKIEECNNHLVKINPDDRIFKRAKSPWRKREFKDELVERNYIFKVAKSTELVNFLIFDSYDVFLPINQENLKFDYRTLEPNARKFYDKINEVYMRLKKETTKNNSLMENLNRWSKLSNERQKARIKVVYNNSGSILKAAVLKGDLIITGDLSFYDSNSLEEAYYLSAILNSPILTEKIRIMKSSRHIFKLPFNLPIKKFDRVNENHQKLAKYGKMGEKQTREFFNFIKSQKEKISKRKLEKKIKYQLNPLLSKINKIVNKEL